jgi:hypothetical protein
MTSCIGFFPFEREGVDKARILAQGRSIASPAAFGIEARDIFRLTLRWIFLIDNDDLDRYGARPRALEKGTLFSVRRAVVMRGKDRRYCQGKEP